MVANIILVGGPTVYVAGFAAPLGIGIWPLNCEVYPLEIRGKGPVAGSITHRTLDMVTAFAILTPINAVTETGTFWLYAFFGIIGLSFYRVVPETKGSGLEGTPETVSR